MTDAGHDVCITSLQRWQQEWMRKSHDCPQQASSIACLPAWSTLKQAVGSSRLMGYTVAVVLVTWWWWWWLTDGTLCVMQHVEHT